MPALATEIRGTSWSARPAAFAAACLGVASLLSAAIPARAAEDGRLIGAAKTGDERLIRSLLDGGADTRGQAGSIAVAEAAKYGRAKALELLLSRGASVEAIDPNSYSSPRKAITLAAAIGSEESVAALLRHGASPNTRNEFPFRIPWHEPSPSSRIDNHKSALMYAAEGGHARVARQLLDAGAKPNAKTVYGETALMFAAGNGRTEAVRALIQGEADLDLAARDENAEEVRGNADYGGTALAYAVRHAYHLMLQDKARGGKGDCREDLAAAYEIVAVYEEKKRRVSDSDRVLKFGLLCGEVPLLSRLVALRAVKRGSDVLLILHATKDFPEGVELLIRAGADVNAREAMFGETPLMRAAYGGLGRTVNVLLDAGAEINATTSYGESALWHAAQNNKAEMVSLLLARGADPNLVTRPNGLWFSRGGSALNMAVQRNCMECAKELLRGGANPEIPDMSGRTPVEVLRQAGLLP